MQKVMQFQQNYPHAPRPVHAKVPKMNMDFHVNSMNAPKQKSHQNANVPINLQLIHVVQPNWFVTKPKLISYHAVGMMDMNLWKAIWSIHRMHPVTNACAMKSSAIKLIQHKIQAVNQLNVVLNCISWATYNWAAFLSISMMAFAAHSNSNAVRSI